MGTWGRGSGVYNRQGRTKAHRFKGVTSVNSEFDKDFRHKM